MEVNNRMVIELNPTEQIQLCCDVYAAEPIYSPRGYSREVFGNHFEQMECDADGNVLKCMLQKKILYRSLEKWIANLTLDGDSNVNWYFIDSNGKKHNVG